MELFRRFFGQGAKITYKDFATFKRVVLQKIGARS